MIDIDKAIDLKSQGKTLAEVASFFSCSVSSVWRALRAVGCHCTCKRGRKPGCKPKRIPWSTPKPERNPRDERICRLVAEGKTLAEVGLMFCISRQRVHAIVSKQKEKDSAFTPLPSPDERLQCSHREAID